MKHVIFILVLSSLGNISLAQIQMGFDTTIMIGNENQIYSNRHIAIDHQNNKFISGFFKGSLCLDTFNLSTSTNITNNSYEQAQGMFVAKYDSSNILKWVKFFAEGDSLFDAILIIDNADNLIISYKFLSKLFLNGDSIVTSQGRTNINLSKYSNDGIKLNTKTFPGYAGVTDFSFDEDNNIYLSGGIGEDNNTNYQIVLGNDTIYTDKGDMLLAKMDTLFNILWIKAYGGHGTDAISQLTYSNGALYALGLCYEAGTSNNNIGGIQVVYSTNYMDKYLIAKFDTLGNGIWVRKFGSLYNGALGSLSTKSIIMKKGGIFFTGTGYNQNQLNLLFEGGNNLLGGSSNFDYFIACYDTNGVFKWNTISKSYGSEYLTQLTCDSNSNLYAVGNFDYPTYFPNDTLYSFGGDDAFVCSYDSAGNFRWVAGGGGGAAEMGSGIALDSHEKIFIVGGTTSSGGCVMGNDTLYPPANQSTLFFSSLDSIALVQGPNGISPMEPSAKVFNIYPNPAMDNVCIKGKNVKATNIYVSLFSYLGEKILQTTLNTSSAIMDVSKQPNGAYMLKIETETGKVEIHPFLIHH